MQAQRLIVAFQAACGDPIPLPELSAAEIQGWALTEAIAASDETPKGLLKVAGAGLLTGVLTPLLPPLIDRINGTPTQLSGVGAAFLWSAWLLFWLDHQG